MVRPCLCFLVYCMQMVWSSTSGSHCRWRVAGDDLVWCRELKRTGCRAGRILGDMRLINIILWPLIRTITNNPATYAPNSFRCYQMNLWIIPGSESQTNGLDMNIQSVIKLMVSYPRYSKIPLHRALSTMAGDRWSRQKRYGKTKYLNSKRGLGTIVKAVEATNPNTKSTDCE